MVVGNGYLSLFLFLNHMANPMMAKAMASMAAAWKRLPSLYAPREKSMTEPHNAIRTPILMMEPPLLLFRVTAQYPPAARPSTGVCGCWDFPAYTIPLLL